MSNQTLETKCVCCVEEWKTRKNTSYENLGSKSIPFVFGIEMISKFGVQRIKLLFCDLHGNNSEFRRVIRYVNETGVLQIRNVNTNRWRNAEKIGVVV